MPASTTTCLPPSGSGSVRKILIPASILVLFPSASIFGTVANAFVPASSSSTAAPLLAKHPKNNILIMNMVSEAGVDPLSLLYQDQQEAMHRRALLEEELLKRTTLQVLEEPKIKASPVKSGTGFGSGGGKKKEGMPERIASQQAKILKRDGVIRFNQVLTPDTTDKLREYVLEQQRIAKEKTDVNPSLARSFYGVEQSRKSRCDLQLSLLKGGYDADDGEKQDSSSSKKNSNPLAQALQELLGTTNGTLRPIYENLVTTNGELYELASVITNPGSLRQIVHPDLPHQNPAPLYVVFLALQDVTEEMGPTTFLIGSHTSKSNIRFNNVELKDELLQSSDVKYALLNKGDAVLFDARILHCGNANQSANLQRALFNFSFRNPKVKGSLGYDGSIRPGYVGMLDLESLGSALDLYENGDDDPFAKVGSGLKRRSSTF